MEVCRFILAEAVVASMAQINPCLHPCQVPFWSWSLPFSPQSIPDRFCTLEHWKRWLQPPAMWRKGRMLMWEEKLWPIARLTLLGPSTAVVLYGKQGSETFKSVASVAGPKKGLFGFWQWHLTSLFEEESCPLPNLLHEARG